MKQYVEQFNFIKYEEPDELYINVCTLLNDELWYPLDDILGSGLWSSGVADALSKELREL